MDSINLDAISDIETKIDPCDMVSLMFLLYEDPHAALQNLTIFQRVSKDIGGTTCNLLKDWVATAQKRSIWKWKLLEALTTCQLYTVIRKLGFGFESPSAKSLSRKDSDRNIFIHPIKKLFYAVCENMDSEKYKIFKNFIKDKYKTEISDHDNCEVFFLELICRGFFSPVNTSIIYLDDVEKLIDILKKISVSGNTRELQAIYDKLNKMRASIQEPQDEKLFSEKQPEDHEKKFVHDFNDSFELFNQLSLISAEELKNDSGEV